MIPLGDENPAHRFPFFTIALIAVCLWVFVTVQPLDGASSVEAGRASSEEAFLLEYAAIPCEITRNAPLTRTEVRDTFDRRSTDTCAPSATGAGGAAVPGKNIAFSVLASVFLHGGWIHLLSNMLFLWIFGNNIEDRLRHVRFLGFYLLAGVAATAGHVLAQPDSAIPIVGASGAIAGVMGAYLVLHPTVRIRTFIFVFLVSPPAWLFLGFWFVSQFYVNPNSGVAWVAHVAGFLFGVVMGIVLRHRGTRVTEGL